MSFSTFRYFVKSRAPAISYTGNIVEWVWKHSSVGTSQMHAMTYDKFSRLTSSEHAVYTSASNSWVIPEAYFAEQGITYDRNGNIKTLKRYASGALEDDFVYSYSGNQLSSINITNTYVYDANGNCTADGLSALKLEYNFLNLTGVVKDASTNSIKASYTWLSDGSKVAVKNAAKTGGYEYLSSLIYTRTSASAVALESAAFSGGRINKTSGGYDINYFLTDHLGSTRVVVNGATGKAIERNDYYPFGSRHATATLPTTTNRFRFSGKENQTIGDLPLQDFGARLYNPRIGRWITRDRLAELYVRFSPYNYCLNNPIRLIDPKGLSVVEHGDTTTYTGNDARQIFERLKAKYSGSGIIDRFFGFDDGPDADPRELAKADAQRKQLAADLGTAAEIAIGILPWGNLTAFLFAADQGEGDAMLAIAPWLIVDAVTLGEGTEVVTAAKRAAKEAAEWLGKDYRVISKSGNYVFMSKDGLRKMRLDIGNPHGDLPHMHLEEFVNGKWKDAIPKNHRLYPKQ